MLFIIIVHYVSLAFLIFSAIAAKDYVPIIDIVSFLSEEVVKTVDIFINDDKNIEFDENFFLYLTSGEGVHLSPFSTAEVIIRNDDGENVVISDFCMASKNQICYNSCTCRQAPVCV